MEPSTGLQGPEGAVSRREASAFGARNGIPGAVSLGYPACSDWVCPAAAVGKVQPAAEVQDQGQATAVYGRRPENQRRPAHISTREEAGHWEGGLIMGKGNKTAIATLVERSSRFLVALALRPGIRSDSIRDQLIEAFEPIPATLRRTLTWDRGSEMAKHAEVTAVLGTLVYFCDPASPWQALLRQYFRKAAT